MPEHVLTFADFRIWGDCWRCRWCRAKAPRIVDIEHYPGCRLLKETSMRCSRCGWTGPSDDISATDYGEGETILECPGCATLSEPGEYLQEVE